ncbi:hypothetical protein HPB50_028474 [Hyalomma asiaticum]|nr:hypothetical protein HPB50_028474 [Hyalomma asiaticum]
MSLQVPLARLNQHLQTWQCEPAACESCGTELPSSFLYDHLRDDCPKCLVRCHRRCRLNVDAEVLDPHDCQETIRRAMKRYRTKLCEEWDEVLRKADIRSKQIDDTDTYMTMHQ